jgi:hypothetical protein
MIPLLAAPAATEESANTQSVPTQVSWNRSSRLFEPVPKRPQPSAQCSETLEKWALPRTSVFVTVCSHPIPAVRFVGISVGIVLVLGEQTFTATFAIPNEGN